METISLNLQVNPFVILTLLFLAGLGCMAFGFWMQYGEKEPDVQVKIVESVQD